MKNISIIFVFATFKKRFLGKSAIFKKHFLNAIADVTLAPKGDFIVDKYTFEVGGKNKTFDQIKDLPNNFVVADDIEIGHKNKIPLWIFGMLY